MRTTSTLATLVSMLASIGCQPQESPFLVEEPEECSVDTQKTWVLDVMHEFYLWNAELPSAVDISAYETPEELLESLRQDPDRWTRVADKVKSDALFMEGKFVGLGYKTERLEDDSIRISFVSDNSPASAAGIVRGDKIVAVQGVTVEQLDETGWGDVYGEDEPGVEVELTVEKLASGAQETHVLTKVWIDIVSVPVVEVLDGPNGEKIGYFVMDKFVETTKAELSTAFEQFEAAGIDQLVVDMRYNGGGLISVAEMAVNLMVGAGHDGETAYRFEYNDNLSSENYSTEVNSIDHSLDLHEIVFLTSSRTRSASELVINALFPYAEVTLVGGDTGGKPVGSKGFDFCEKVLFPITFRLVNAAGKTDYFEGLPASCLAEDDLFHQLGDPSESMLAAALEHLGTGTCAQPLPPPDARGGGRVDSIGEVILPNPQERYDIDSW